MLDPKAKPLAIPAVPPLTAQDNSVTAENKVELWLAHAQSVRDYNDALFSRAEKRMKLCNYLNGFLRRSTSQHFSWCPHEVWARHWEEQGFPPIEL